MNGANQSIVSEFVLLGLSNSWKIQVFLFFFSCLFYLSSLIGNLLIVITVISDPDLHSPMYFLLANLSVIDLIFCSIATPKMISDLFRKLKVISFGGCIAQIFFSHAVGGTEMALLTAMAFDRYVAICKPLHYLAIMSPRVCIFILVAAWTIGLIHSSVQLTFVVNLPFCGPNVLDSFYCDLLHLIKLACIDTYKLHFMVTANSGFISLGALFMLLFSYFFLLATLKKHSLGSSSKAVSTLSAHITVVVLFFGPLIFFYTWPSPKDMDKFLALFDAVLTPFLNPVIYTFRSRGMRVAMRKVFRQLLGVRKPCLGGKTESPSDSWKS
ncbi:olfactory receptor 4F15-like [Fukomys damarensis]|uniref:olfactory receptor 4F15-like n=1 Tax=Fukomys damarensis TaxID=885580 RepID=UPI00053F3AD1|nr:olfactory receptor 4F15-like [Fukomys damarensis]